MIELKKSLLIAPEGIEISLKYKFDIIKYDS